ncbi:hypothetical protein ACROYT_G044364 [Oculina patagonica]
MRTFTSVGREADESSIHEMNDFSVPTWAVGMSLGFRMRTFFLCSLTGVYEFYFSCYGACEWFMKASENSGLKITGGNSSLGMPQQDFKIADSSANLTEGSTYFIEVLLFHPLGESDGHFHLKVKGPRDNSTILVPREQLVAYQQDGSYGTLHPDSCKAYHINLTNDNVTSFSIPFNASILPEHPTEEQPVLENDTIVWCFNESATSYIELNFTVPYHICAIETQGIQTSDGETKYVTSFRIEFFEEVSANCSEWKFYNASGNATVFEGNSYDDRHSSKINYLIDANITTSAIRIWPVQYSNASCMGLKVYGEPASGSGGGGAGGGGGGGGGGGSGGAEENLLVLSTSSSSLLIRWGHLKQSSHSGATNGYVINITNSSGISTNHNVSFLEDELEVTGLQKYSVYCVTVKAVIGKGFGNESEEICASTAEDAPSAPPANISVTVTAFDTIIITWDEVSLQERNGIVREYKLFVKSGDQDIVHEAVIAGHVTNMEVSSLVDNTAYCVQLLAHTVADGPLSACVNVTTLKRVPTDAPKIIEVFNTSSTSLLIRWDHWRDYFDPDVTVGYLIKRTDHNNVTEEIILKDLAQEKTLTRLNKYKEYCVTVTAITRIGHVEGYGDESDEVCAFTAEDAPSAPPANISVTATAVDTIFITWEEVPEQERNGIVREYKVYVKNVDQIIEHESVVNAHVTTLEVSNLVHNTYYCVQLLAYTVADGALSVCVNVTTLKKECYDALGMESGSILDAQITASSQWNENHAAKQGRLHFQKTDSTAGGWSAATHDANQWLQIDLGGQYFRVTGVATQGRNEDDTQWVTKYKLQYSNDEVTFQYYIEQGQTTDKEFAGNEDRDTVVSHELNPPIRARYIRFVPVAWNAHISMRVELYGCQVPSAPPANISVTATAVDTIFITWQEVPVQERNGIIRGYKVYVKNAEQVVEHESVVNASVTTLEVSNLVHDTYYCVQLLAYTVADGALSACVNVTTLKGD